MSKPLSRHDGRPADGLRPIRLERGAVPYAEGSCLVSFGNTRVLCAASVQEGVPGWRRGAGEGWVTAEYSMLPRATQQRTQRERGQVGGRTQEIQRLIGRSLRSCVALDALGDWTIRIDCDVLQADGGTRTAAVTGGAVALYDACLWIVRRSKSTRSAFQGFVAAVSAGIVGGHVLLDLDYSEDSEAEVDLNVVGSAGGRLIEVQGTGERGTFTAEQLSSMVGVASTSIERLIAEQQACVQ
ncbi:MAG: ribonuclease PH [Gemmatimonadetes bacterium]|nr:ribonuclease PH [Gemmatimonadota bacterium]